MTPIPPMQSAGESSQFQGKTHRLHPAPESPSKQVLPRVRIPSQPFTSISKINVTVSLLLVNTIKKNSSNCISFSLSELPLKASLEGREKRRKRAVLREDVWFCDSRSSVV